MGGLVSVLLLPGVDGADVYKWTDPDGRIHYTDRRVMGAEQLEIQIDHSLPTPENHAIVARGSADLGPCNAFEIVEAEPAETLRVRKASPENP